jgi:hypothetical protein
MTRMLNEAGYEVFYAETMTREQAEYCIGVARPKTRYKGWASLRHYYMDPILTWVYPADHPFRGLTTDQCDNALEAIRYFQNEGVSVESVLGGDLKSGASIRSRRGSK